MAMRYLTPGNSFIPQETDNSKAPLVPVAKEIADSILGFSIPGADCFRQGTSLVWIRKDEPVKRSVQYVQIHPCQVCGEHKLPSELFDAREVTGVKVACQRCIDAADSKERTKHERD